MGELSTESAPDPVPVRAEDSIAELAAAAGQIETALAGSVPVGAESSVAELAAAAGRIETVLAGLDAPPPLLQPDERPAPRFSRQRYREPAEDQEGGESLPATSPSSAGQAPASRLTIFSRAAICGQLSWVRIVSRGPAGPGLQRGGGAGAVRWARAGGAA